MTASMTSGHARGGTPFVPPMPPFPPPVEDKQQYASAATLQPCDSGLPFSLPSSAVHSIEGRRMGYYVYILSSRKRVLYIGVTNDLLRRMHEHKNKLVRGFTAQYNVDSLVHFENTHDPAAAIAREKQLKGWLRIRKLELIISTNPIWQDLSADWGKPIPAFEESDRLPPITFFTPSS